MAVKKTRLQRKKEKESLKQAWGYLVLILALLWLIVKLGLPALVKMSTFIGNLRQPEPIEQTAATPVLPPRLEALPADTNKAQLNVAGYSQEGTTVKLYLRGLSVTETIADKEGRFVFSDVNLRVGENEIYTVAGDDKGNTSDRSNVFVVSFDQSAPQLTVETPSESDRFFDNDNPITVAGQAEAEVTVKINGRIVKAGDDGSFTTQLTLEEGDNQIEVLAVDRAENETVKLVTVNYTP
ncbi:TPA: hypothetical protein DEB02_00015 [Candidatus Beckwithbacteria bacterium]|nr:hypothetical protein [Candidatus Beckwithbacteria bacterium]